MKTSFKPCLPAIYSPETLVNVTHNITSLTNALTNTLIKTLVIIRNVHVHNRQKKTKNYTCISPYFLFFSTKMFRATCTYQRKSFQRIRSI